MREVIDDNFMGILAIVLVCMLVWDDLFHRPSVRDVIRQPLPPKRW